MRPAGTIYQIRVKGRLGPEWSPWFDGLTIQTLCGGESVLSGPLPDQAALHGILLKIRNLGLELLSLSRVDTLPPPA